MLKRSYNISSDYHLLHDYIFKLVRIFHLNGYPKSLLDKLIRSFIITIRNPKPIPQQEARKHICIALPFLGNHSTQVRKCLKQRVHTCYPSLSPGIIFSATSRIASFPPTKDLIPTPVAHLWSTSTRVLAAQPRT